MARPRHLAVVPPRPLLQLGETVLAGQRAVAAAGAASRVLLYALETIGTQLLLPRILHEGLADHRHGSAAAPLPRCPQHPGAVSAVMLSVVTSSPGRPGGYSTFTSRGFLNGAQVSSRNLDEFPAAKRGTRLPGVSLARRRDLARRPAQQRSPVRAPVTVFLRAEANQQRRPRRRWRSGAAACITSAEQERPELKVSTKFRRNAHNILCEHLSNWDTCPSFLFVHHVHMCGSASMCFHQGEDVFSKYCEPQYFVDTFT